MATPLITLLTDFGTADHYVAAMKGVMAGICPEARFVDITHEVEPYAIAEAAFTLSQAWKYFPPGTVHLVVVDPGVGSARRAILAEAGGHWFVAPDNGVLTLALAADPNSSVREITNKRYFRPNISQTFHGRDIFAPVAAHLAAGVAASEFGPLMGDPARLALQAQEGPDGSWDGVILKVDHYGNAITSLPSDLVHRNNLITGVGWFLEIGSPTVTNFAATYSEAAPGNLFVIAGSSGLLEISVNQGSAARETGAKAGDPVRFRFNGDTTGGMP